MINGATTPSRRKIFLTELLLLSDQRWAMNNVVFFETITLFSPLLPSDESIREFGRAIDSSRFGLQCVVEAFTARRTRPVTFSSFTV